MSSTSSHRGGRQWHTVRSPTSSSRPTTRPARSASTRSSFGWDFQGSDGLRRLFHVQHRSRSSIRRRGRQRGESTGDKLRIYVTVDSIDDALAKVPGLGGTVVTPKTEIPGQGWYAVVYDSEGSELGLYENLPSPAGVNLHGRAADRFARPCSGRGVRERCRGTSSARRAPPGVERILVPGWDLESSRASLELAAALRRRCFGRDPPARCFRVRPRLGSRSLSLRGDREVVAVGETGLDYDRGFSPREDQLTNLRRHLALATELGKPAILHCRSRPGRARRAGRPLARDR